METLHPDVEKVLFTEEDIAEIVKRLGAKITEDYQGKDLVLIAVLRGAVVFMGDLIKDLDIDINGRDVLIVEDVLDSGLTLKYLMKNLASRHPASLEVCTFLWKDVEGKQVAIDPKYVGTHCPDEFVVGYGLDYAERYRNLPYVGVLKPEVYA